MDDMYKTTQQAKHRFFEIDEVYKIGDEWNVQNLQQNCANSRII